MRSLPLPKAADRRAGFRGLGKGFPPERRCACPQAYERRNPAVLINKGRSVLRYGRAFRVGQDDDFLPRAQFEAGDAGFAVHQHEGTVAKAAACPKAEIGQREQVGPGGFLFGGRGGQQEAEGLVQTPALRFFRHTKRDAAVFGAVRGRGHEAGLVVVWGRFFDIRQASGYGGDAEEEPDEIHVGLQR